MTEIEKKIPSDLSTRFCLRRKYWRIYLEDKFEDLVKRLEKGELGGGMSSPETRLKKCIEDMSVGLDNLCKKIYEHHAGKHLEDLIVNILKEIPDVNNESISRKSGRSDKGGDIIFQYERIDCFGKFSSDRCAIQVKSYEGVIDFDQAINDIRNVFNDDAELKYGIIMTTATSMVKNISLIKELIFILDNILSKK